MFRRGWSFLRVDAGGEGAETVLGTQAERETQMPRAASECGPGRAEARAGGTGEGGVAVGGASKAWGQSVDLAIWKGETREGL